MNTWNDFKNNNLTDLHLYNKLTKRELKCNNISGFTTDLN